MSVVDSIPDPPDVFSRPAMPLTRADLDRMPDDGYRRELIDGVLLVTPSPSFNHQDVASNLLIHLRQVCPPELYVMVAPFDMVLADDTVMIPDLLVARRDGQVLAAGGCRVSGVLGGGSRHAEFDCVGVAGRRICAGREGHRRGIGAVDESVRRDGGAGGSDLVTDLG
ncbi:Uma2 family endonuclease [Kribbella soli]|uniref:Uma2 family endonuclease n=1 Tax=Kribbella soli TaxID=1124743 RepID=UPI00307BD501